MPAVTHKARQLKQRDFTSFEYILCMDEENLRNINMVKPPNSTAHIGLLGEFDPEGESIIGAVAGHCLSQILTLYCSRGSILWWSIRI